MTLIDSNITAITEQQVREVESPPYSGSKSSLQ